MTQADDEDDNPSVEYQVKAYPTHLRWRDVSEDQYSTAWEPLSKLYISHDRELAQFYKRNHYAPGLDLVAERYKNAKNYVSATTRMAVRARDVEARRVQRQAKKAAIAAKRAAREAKRAAKAAEKARKIASRAQSKKAKGASSKGKAA